MPQTATEMTSEELQNSFGNLPLDGDLGDFGLDEASEDFSRVEPDKKVTPTETDTETEEVETETETEEEITPTETETEEVADTETEEVETETETEEEITPTDTLNFDEHFEKNEMLFSGMGITKKEDPKEFVEDLTQSLNTLNEENNETKNQMETYKNVSNDLWDKVSSGLEAINEVRKANNMPEIPSLTKTLDAKKADIATITTAFNNALSGDETIKNQGIQAINKFIDLNNAEMQRLEGVEQYKSVNPQQTPDHDKAANLNLMAIKDGRGGNTLALVNKFLKMEDIGNFFYSLGIKKSSLLANTESKAAALSKMAMAVMNVENSEKTIQERIDEGVKQALSKRQVKISKTPVKGKTIKTKTGPVVSDKKESFHDAFMRDHLNDNL